MTKRKSQVKGEFALLLGALLGICPVHALAQEFTLLPAEYSTIDRNNVDYASLKPSFDLTDVSIGTASQPLASSIRIARDNGATLTWNFDGGVNIPTGTYSFPAPVLAYYGCSANNTAVVTIGTLTDGFCLAGAQYVSIRNPAATLIKNADGTYLYTSSDGTQYYCQRVMSGVYVYLSKIVRPDGLTTQLFYNGTSGRLQSVVRNDGLQLRRKYNTDGTIAGVEAINMTVDYCDPSAVTCTESRSWPTSMYSFTYPSSTVTKIAVTDQGSETTLVTYTSDIANFIGYISGYKPPTSASQDTISYTYCTTAESGHFLCTATKDNATWQYNLGISWDGSHQDSHTAMTSQGPTYHTDVLTHSTPGGALAPLVYSDDPDGARRQFDETAPTNRIQTYSLGVTRNYFYDSRGNVTSVTYSPKAGSPPVAAITLIAKYDDTCTSPAKCNKPNWTKDANGNQTDMTYDPNHGGLLTVTKPADSNGIRAQVRYNYVQRYAWYKATSATVVQASTSIWVLSSEKYCRSSAALANGTGCAGTNGSYNDEVVTTYDYGPTTGANNLFLRGTAVTADGVTLRTCYSYDALGNKISETLPNANLATCP